MVDGILLPLLFTLLIPFALPGLALINTGLNRTRSAAHSMLSSMCAAAVAVLVFVMFGSGQFFSRHIHTTDPHGALVLIFQLFAVSVAAQIPVASGAERWRLSATCISTAVLAGLLFPLLSSWLWRGGFGVMDAGGAAVQVMGGLTALVIAWQLGPRHGKFTAEGIPTAMPGHNAVVVVVGSLFALIGWTGLIAGGSLLFYNASPGAALLAVVNTLVAASGGAIAALITTRMRFGKPDTSLTANGWVAGLVAVSAGAPFLKISEAMLIGLAAGILVVFAIEVVELRMHIDDPAGAIAVHAVGGIWGLFAAGIFAGRFLPQLQAVGALIGFVVPVAYVANSFINRFVPHRIVASGERQGLDLYELGAGAYPEFVTHREDFPRR